MVDGVLGDPHPEVREGKALSIQHSGRELAFETCELIWKDGNPSYWFVRWGDQFLVMPSGLVSPMRAPQRAWGIRYPERRMDSTPAPMVTSPTTRAICWGAFTTAFGLPSILMAAPVTSVTSLRHVRSVVGGSGEGLLRRGGWLSPPVKA